MDFPWLPKSGILLDKRELERLKFTEQMTAILHLYISQKQTNNRNFTFLQNKHMTAILHVYSSQKQKYFFSLLPQTSELKQRKKHEIDI